MKILFSAMAMLMMPAALGLGADIASVKTMDELRAVPVTHLGTGWDVRVGVAEAGGEGGPWLVLYCEAKYVGAEPRPGTPEDRDPQEVLGPLVVRHRWDNTLRLEYRVKAQSM